MESYGPALTKSEAELRGYLRIKRFQDVVLSVLALVVLSPLLLLISLAIVIDDPKGGPIFSQMRVGKNGRLFRMYKFRSMCIDAEDRLKDLARYNEMDSVTFKIKKDPRVTRVGMFLRKSSLDELPQLVNILRGDMTIVGPRPPLPREVAEYSQYQRQRLTVRPGLTCYWQVRPDRYDLTLDEWVDLDLKYIRDRNWWLDWWLIWQTLKTMLRGDGV